MKVALIHFIPSTSEKNYLAFPHGLASISASIKLDGHHTSLFTLSKLDNASVSDIGRYDPGAIFVYLTTNQYRLFIDCMAFFSKMGVPVFVGGPHPTCASEETAHIPGVTGVCVGDGEVTAREILGRLTRDEPLDGIENLVFFRDDELVKPISENRILDLDSLPFPDRGIFPYEDHIGSREMDILGIEFFFSRGCNYSCSFCMNSKKSAFKDRAERIRRRSVRSVVDEISSVTQKYQYRGVLGFQDDAFSSSLSWLEEFAAEYRKRIGLPFWCNAHVSQLGENRIKTLRHAGCFRVQVGVECGDEELRAKVLNKKISNKRIIQTADLLRKHHIKLVAYFMVGLPDETEEQILKSIDLCRQIKPDWTLVSTFCPYPGTAIYEQLVKEGRLDPHYYKTMPVDTYYSGTAVYDQRGVTDEKLHYYYSNFVELALSRYKKYTL